MKINDCKIQTGNIKIIHPINLTNLEDTLGSINEIVKAKKNDKIELYKLLEEKCKKLWSNFKQIKPYRRTRQKRWDQLGSAWKWLAGNPDAQDLRIINTTMNELIDSNNQQLHINEQINERIRLITDTVNRVITNTSMVNKVIITEIDMITLIINIDTINAILEDIQDAILRTKVELASNKILSIKEIMLIKDLLVDQGVDIPLPDEALQYVIPKIAMNDETILYILQVPKLETEYSATMLITPLTYNETIIKNYPQYLIRSNQKLLTTLNHKNFVQKDSEIMEFKDECIKPLIMGTKSTCNVTASTETTIHLIADDKIIIDNAKGEILSSDCGPSNRTLTGNFLITFGNCTILFNNKEFQSHEIRTETHEIQGAFHNLQITRQLITTIDVDLLNQQNFQNRKEIRHIHLKQTNHRSWMWMLSGGVSFSTLFIISIAILYIITRKRQTTITIENPSVPQPEIVSNQYLKLLKEAGVKRKNEDVLFSPPGEVTFPQYA